MLQLLTPTGGRPQQWALTEQWAAAQTHDGPVRWIVVDDCDPPQRIAFRRPNWTVEVIRPVARWQSGQNTQARNLLTGLDAADPAEPILCWEDDDYYAPRWLTTVLGWLDQAELVGQLAITYYNVATRRWKTLSNGGVSGSSTAIRDAALTTFRAVLLESHPLEDPSPQFIDGRLWGITSSAVPLHPSRRAFPGCYVVSIKGLPGRQGIGIGHRQNFGTKRDADGGVLRAMIGRDAAVYRSAFQAVA